MRPSKSRSQRRPLHMSRRFHSVFGCAVCIGAALFVAKGLSYRTAEASAPAPTASAGENPPAEMSATGVPASGVPASRVPAAGAPVAEKANPAVLREVLASERASDDPSAVAASDPGPAASDDLADMQTSVRQLMLQETHHALLRSKGGVSSGPGRSARPHSPPGSAREGPYLRAIYGVGQRLLAEVSVGSETLVFLKGHPVPMGYKAGAAPYRLTEWDKHCIRLEEAGTHAQFRSRATGSLPTERIDLESARDNRGAPRRDNVLIENLSLCLRPQAGEG